MSCLVVMLYLKMTLAPKPDKKHRPGVVWASALGYAIKVRRCMAQVLQEHKLCFKTSVHG